MIFTYTSLMDPQIGGWQPAYMSPVKGFEESKDGQEDVELGVVALDDYTV